MAFCFFVSLLSSIAFPVFAQAAVVFEVETEKAIETAEEISPAPKKPALTEPIEEVIGPLERLLREQKIGSLGLTNFFKHAIREAVAVSVPVNTIVLLLLFPLIAALIAAARHFLGVGGFGIFTPVMVSVAFLATGVIPGLTLFLVILLMATIARIGLKKIKVHYLPRMAILLWFICIGSFLAILKFPSVSIFPILFMILLVENFIEVQIGRSMREALGMTAETLLIALACYFLMSWKFLQAFVLLNPEIAVFGVLLFNIFVGRYTGFRLLEKHRLKAVMRR